MRSWFPQRPEGPLHGLVLAVLGEGAAVQHAARLLASLGASVIRDADNGVPVDGLIDAVGSAARDSRVPTVHTSDVSALYDWTCSGAMALTGRWDGPALAAPGQVGSATRGALLAAELLARVGGCAVTLPGVQLLAERAAGAGLSRSAPSSAGGAFRVLAAADGWLGLNLARDSDVELIAAWLECDPVPAGDPWPVVTELVGGREAGGLAERARLLGLPAVAMPSAGVADEQLAVRGQSGVVWPLVLNGQVHRAVESEAAAPSGRGGGWALPSMLVVDLSSLWAGPLCGHLLQLLGARVVKVESVRRPDGARFGPAGFYDLLHVGQESVAIDFDTTEGRAQLAGLVEAADVVIEGSRPRALAQLGVHAEEVLARAEAKCWVGISAYGRSGPWCNAVGFGDDTAVAGGLLAIDSATGTPAPCGDAIADPLTGVHAALATVACRMGGGIWLVDLALREQVAATLNGAHTEVDATPSEIDVASPRVRRPAARAAPLGAHTERVLTELGLT